MKSLHTIWFIRIVLAFFALLFISMLSSCAGRMQKYCEKHYLKDLYDTTHFSVPYYLPRDSVVFSFRDSLLRDTMIETDRTRLIIRRDSIHNFIHCESKPKRDTIIVKEIIKVREYKKRDRPWWEWAILGAIVSFAAIALLRR